MDNEVRPDPERAGELPDERARPPALGEGRKPGGVRRRTPWGGVRAEVRPLLGTGPRSGWRVKSCIYVAYKTFAAFVPRGVRAILR
jgi:hypothetical protein